MHDSLTSVPRLKPGLMIYKFLYLHHVISGYVIVINPLAVLTVEHHSAGCLSRPAITQQPPGDLSVLTPITSAVADVSRESTRWPDSDRQVALLRNAASAAAHLSSDACVHAMAVRLRRTCFSRHPRVSGGGGGERDCCMDHEHESIYL